MTQELFVGMKLGTFRRSSDVERPTAYATIDGERVSYEDYQLTCDEKDLAEFIRRASDSFRDYWYKTHKMPMARRATSSEIPLHG